MLPFLPVCMSQRYNACMKLQIQSQVCIKNTVTVHGISLLQWLIEVLVWDIMNSKEVSPDIKFLMF